MARVLLLATTTGYQTRAFGDASETLGVNLVFATDRCDRIDDPWQDGAIAIRFHEEDRSVASIVDEARARPIDGILVVGDRPTVIGARAAAALGIPWHSAEAAAVARHKQLTRERLRRAGLPTPWFVRSTINELPSATSDLASALSLTPGATATLAEAPDARRRQPLTYPCVVKPVALSGSRGVIRADDHQSFLRALERVKALLRAPDILAERNASHEAILIEGFIPGREYAIEGLMHHGQLQVLAIFDKPDPLDGPFFEETIYVTPSSASDAEQRAIVDAIAQAAAAIGLHHGPIHAECRVNAGGVFVLEVAARPIGGICARALRFQSAIRNPQSAIRNPQSAIRNPQSAMSLEELLLRHALGEAPHEWKRERDASGVMMIPIPRRGVYRGVEGVEEAKRVAHVTDVRMTAKTDQMLIPLPEGASYLGFIFARAGTPAAVVEALRAAHARLSFRIDAEFPVLKGSQLRYNHAHG